VASDYQAKYYLVSDSVRMNRSDGGLVRLMTPMIDGESPDAAQARVMKLCIAVPTAARQLHSALILDSYQGIAFRRAEDAQKESAFRRWISDSRFAKACYG